MNIESIARVCHEVNRAFCKSIGDDSQPAWEVAPEWQQSSAIAGVEFIRDNPDASPSASHNSWLKQKTAEGWKYGPVKDPIAKEHPCYVPYDQLPTEQKSKDYIFGAIVRALFTTEDGSVIDKVKHAPERKIFCVDVGNMNTDEARSLINEFKSKLTVAEDLFTPTQNL